jgi:membrane protein required for beta-lactamase induction
MTTSTTSPPAALRQGIARIVHVLEFFPVLLASTKVVEEYY